MARDDTRAERAPRHIYMRAARDAVIHAASMRHVRLLDSASRYAMRQIEMPCAPFAAAAAHMLLLTHNATIATPLYFAYYALLHCLMLYVTPLIRHAYAIAQLPLMPPLRSF